MSENADLTLKSMFSLLHQAAFQNIFWVPILYRFWCRYYPHSTGEEARIQYVPEAHLIHSYLWRKVALFIGTNLVQVYWEPFLTKKLLTGNFPTEWPNVCPIKSLGKYTCRWNHLWISQVPKTGTGTWSTVVMVERFFHINIYVINVAINFRCELSVFPCHIIE